MTLFSDVKRKVLDNGLEILVREDHSSPVAALNFFVRVGSLNEDEAIAGWSHGIEHMLFKGTERRGPGDIAREISNSGGQTNAGTGYESTNYYIILPSQNFPTALDIHADVLRNSIFDEYELEKERQVLIKENAMYRDRPSGFGFTWEALLAEAFTTHRYQRPIGGPDENLLRVGRDAIWKYKETYYVPNNLTYVVVGDVEAETVFATIEEKLGSWGRTDLVPDTSPPEPVQELLRFRESDGDVEKGYVKIGFHIPPELDPDTHSLMVLAHILASGRSSRLIQRVREDQGLILGAHIMETTGNEPGYMVVEFEAEPEKMKTALVEVMRQILLFQSEPVTAAELERTLRAVRNETVYTLETMEGQAQMLGHYALLGDYRLAGTYMERLAEVSPRRIHDVARHYLGLNQATIFAYGPRERTPLAANAEELHPQLREALGSTKTSSRDFRTDTVAAVVPTGSGRTRAEVESVTLDSGARVLLQQDGRLPLVALSAFLPSGSGSETDDLAGVTRLTQNCMLKGAGGKSRAALAESLDRMGARLRPFSGRDTCGFSLGVVREDLPQAMELFQTVLTRPDFPQESLDRERDRTLAQLAALRDDTVQFTVSEFYRLIFPAHAYGRQIAGSESSVAGLTREHLCAQHAKAYDASKMVLSVVGDFDPGVVLKNLESLTSALPRVGNGAGEVSTVATPGEPVREDFYQEVSQAVVVLGYPGPVVTAPERYALDVWDAILSGMGNRLFTTLRDEQHLCYFTGTFVSPLAGGGVVGAYIGTGLDQVDEALQGLLQELERSARELPTDEEMFRAKNNLAGGHLVGMQTRMSWAATYAEDEVTGLGYMESLRYLDEIQKVTAVDVRQSAAAVIDKSRLAMAVLRRSGDSVPVAEPV